MLTRSIYSRFLMLTLLAMAFICWTNLNAQEIQIGPEMGPLSLYGGADSGENRGFLRWVQDGMAADSFGYRYLKWGGFTFDWADYKGDEFDDTNGVNFHSVRERYDMKAYLAPPVDLAG